MNKPRIYHSFWSKPMLEDRMGVPLETSLPSTLMLAAIGVLAAKRLGIEVVLHTDDYGAKLFEHIPYDEVYLSLNGHDIHRNFWASAKMIALEREPLGSCHIDIDAWIKKEECRDIVFGSKKDLVIQHYEHCHEHYDHIKKIVYDNVDMSDLLDMDASTPSEEYNCGLVRVNNQKLKDKWLEGYWHITNTLEKKQPEGIHGLYFVPDLVSEQLLIFQLCKQFNFSVECICDGFGPGNQERAKRIGFTHLVTAEKYEHNDKLIRILLELDPDLLPKIWKKQKQVLCYGK